MNCGGGGSNNAKRSEDYNFFESYNCDEEVQQPTRF